MRFLVYLCVAISGLWFSLRPGVALSMPVALIGRTQVAESHSRSNRGAIGDTAEKASCRQFVGEFYTWYVARSKGGDPLRVALRQKRANFSVEMIRRLNEDARAAAKSPNEIVGLDFDPVLNSQDFAEKYVPGKVTRIGGRYLVEVFSVYGGKRSEVPAVTPELRHERGRWVFTNFLYKTDGKIDNLLNILRQLKAERKKRS